MSIKLVKYHDPRGHEVHMAEIHSTTEESSAGEQSMSGRKGRIPDNIISQAEEDDEN